MMNEPKTSMPPTTTMRKWKFTIVALFTFVLLLATPLLQQALAAQTPETSQNEATKRLLYVIDMDNASVEEITRLIQEGADVNAVGRHGNTPLMHAAFNSNPNVLRVLIENGADVNAINEFGSTIFMRSV
jgi:ankyrin repeat protein